MHALTPCAVAGLALALSACRDEPPTPVLMETAYTDGFEVVVLELAADGSLSSVRSVKLAEAEALIERDQRYSLLIPGDGSDVANALEANGARSGDFGIEVGVENLSVSEQAVRVSFRYSSSRYLYMYKVQGRDVTPLTSGYRDIRRRANVRYVTERPSG